jgi:hypothetical protein
VIGAMKCGTSSLHYYLGLHPEIEMSREKELNFFLQAHNWPLGLEWYRSWFSPERKVRGETSPGYTAYPQHDGVPERMHALLPHAKLIYLVRDPIDRLISHYLHNVTEGKETRTFADAMRDPANPYLQRSRYAQQLEQYLAFYPMSQLLVLKQDDLRLRREATLERAFSFLGVAHDFRDVRFSWERHRSERKRLRTPFGHRLSKTAPMRLLQRVPRRIRWPVEDLIYLPFSRRVARVHLDGATRARLTSELDAEVARLSALTGERYDEWLA